MSPLSAIPVHDRTKSRLQNATSQHSRYCLLICADELVEMLFILRCDSCAWPSRKWLVFHVPVTVPEMHCPPLHCAHSRYLVSINGHQTLMNVSGWHFFYMEKFSDTPLLHTHFHVRCSLVRLPLSCHLSHSNNI